MIKSKLGSFTSKIQVFLKTFPFLFKETMFIVYRDEGKAILSSHIDLLDKLSKHTIANLFRKFADDIENL